MVGLGLVRKSWRGWLFVWAHVHPADSPPVLDTILVVLGEESDGGGNEHALYRLTEIVQSKDTNTKNLVRLIAAPAYPSPLEISLIRVRRARDEHMYTNQARRAFILMHLQSYSY